MKQQMVDAINTKVTAEVEPTPRVADCNILHLSTSLNKNTYAQL